MDIDLNKLIKVMKNQCYIKLNKTINGIHKDIKNPIKKTITKMIDTKEPKIKIIKNKLMFSKINNKDKIVTHFLQNSMEYKNF